MLFFEVVGHFLRPDLKKKNRGGPSVESFLSRDLAWLGDLTHD